LREPALLLARRQAAREVVLRVTQDLLQKPPSNPKENVSNDGQAVESAPAQGANQSITEQKTRILKAIQPVLEVVADSTQRYSEPRDVQL